MAYLIQMYRELCARLAPTDPIEADEVVEDMVKGANQTRGTIISVLAELEYLVVQNLKFGRAVKLPNGWTFQPFGKRDGTVEVTVRLPKKMVDAINADFRGKWINAQNIGMSDEQMKPIWNERHPNDPIVSNGAANGSNGSSEPTTESETANYDIPEAV
jgi:hypothetical protein